MNRILQINWILITLAIVCFLIFEFFLKMPACKLCLTQRLPYYLSFILLCFYRFIKLKYLYFLLMALFCIALGVVMFHILVEEGVITYPCILETTATTVSSLKESLMNEVPNCAKKAVIFGIRLTFASFILGAILISLNIWGFLKEISVTNSLQP